jgi:DNA-binding winged helix-turn-helix (wHTH) protein
MHFEDPASSLEASESPGEPGGGTPLPGLGCAARFARFGPFELDLEGRELLRAGIRIKLQNKVYEALLVLLETPGEIVTRETMRMRLWPGDSAVNYDANVNTTVNKLRQILGDSPDNPLYVETIPRKGYSFVADVRYESCSASAQSEAEARKGDLNASIAASRPGFDAPRGFWDSFERLLRQPSSRWFLAGVVALLLAGILFGAAVTLFQFARSKAPGQIHSHALPLAHSGVSSA